MGSSSLQTEPPLAAVQLEATSRISAVTVYLGRAAVTRTAQVKLATGLADVRFTALPGTIDSTSLQARVSGADAKVIGVDFIERRVVDSGDPAVAALDQEIESTRQAVAALQEDLGLVAEQEKLLAGIGARVSGEASERLGTPQLNLDALGKQIEFVGAQRMGLLAIRRDLTAKRDAAQKSLQALEARRAARAGRGGVAREAVVSLAATGSGQATVELTYLVSNATWTPTYNVRGSLDAKGGGTAGIEYDALIAQRSGEDWNDVALTLSTAQPMRAANPPQIEPWFVDVVVPPPPQPPVSASPPPGRAVDADRKAGAPRDVGGGLGGGLAPAEAESGDAQLRAAVERMRASAEVLSTGPAVSFVLPRPVTVATDSDRMQRSRIASFDAAPEFIHVAVPLLTDSVYLRGTLVNGSPYLLLPGNAAIFLGNDYIGPTTLGNVPPNARFDVFFGIDRNLAARRTLVSRNTERTGLFSGGVRTTSDYRIELDNPTSRPAKMEVLDRIPVSRNEQIEIALLGPSTALSANPEYLRDGRPQGLLRWDLTVPAGATGPSATPVTWGVRISHGKDVRTTALPE